MSRILVALKNIFIDFNFYRIWQIINKSPLIGVVVGIKSFFCLPNVKYRKNLSQSAILNTDQSKCLESLYENGYADVSELVDREMLEKANLHFRGLFEKSKTEVIGQQVNTKSFWIRLTDDEQKNGLDLNNPFVAFSLQESILKVLSKYLGQSPYFHSTLLTHSVPTTGEFKKSQLWHLDNDNHKMIKMFLYFTDVLEEKNGPFTFIPKKFSKKVLNSFFKKHLNDEEIAKFLSLNESIFQVKGKALKVFLCDTHNCYHMGSRVGPGGERLMLTSLYIGLPSPYPEKFNRTILNLKSNLSDFQKAAVFPAPWVG